MMDRGCDKWRGFQENRNYKEIVANWNMQMKIWEHIRKEGLENSHSQETLNAKKITGNLLDKSEQMDEGTNTAKTKQVYKGQSAESIKKSHLEQTEYKGETDSAYRRKSFNKSKLYRVG